jgi:enterochelin esterase family protein
MLIGPSLGGLITLWIGLQHPTTFGLLASQSGSLWFGDGQVLKMLPGAKANGQKLFFEVGSYEVDDMTKYNREGDAICRDNGVTYRYREYPSLHQWPAWRNRLAEIFRYLLIPANQL